MGGVTEVQQTIEAAQELLRTGGTSLPPVLASAIDHLLEESLRYARLPRAADYPVAWKGGVVAREIVREWGGA